MSSYPTRDAAENIFGRNNIAKWADLDGDGGPHSGTLSTRTDNDTGIITVEAGHGITTSFTIDLYWASGKRYGMTVTGTASTTVSLDGGTGDNLPVAATNIVARIADKITARITEGISVVSDEVDEWARGAHYRIPLVNTAGETPRTIKYLAARMLGIWLYEPRAQVDFDAKTGQPASPMAWHVRLVRTALNDILTGRRRLDAELA